MTSDRMAKLCGDPPYRADAYADVTDQFAANRAALRLPRAVKPIERKVLRLWAANQPVGAIAARTGLSGDEVCEILSRGYE